MNDWIAPSTPHADHPYFPFDFEERNPGKDGQWQSAAKPPKRVENPSNAKEQFDTMCAKLLGLIDNFNLETARCKIAATKSPHELAAAKEGYRDAVNRLNQFMGRVQGADAGYKEFLTPGSFKVEVVLSSGFVTAARIFGLSLFTSSSSSYHSTNPPKKP